MKKIFIGVGIWAVYSCGLHAATFNVTTANISGPGSLPVAIAQANGTPGNNKINISVNGVITLGLALPVVTNSVAIAGTASSPTVISGGGTLPLFTFAAGTTNSLSNLVLANGYAMNRSGAAISNAGTLFLSSCIFTNNILQGGPYVINGVTYHPLGGSGGAIFNSGNLKISSSLLSSNQAGIGGAIYNSGTMLLKNSQLSLNQATNGGAIFNAGTSAVDTLTLSNNLATAGFGGGIYNTGVLYVSQSTFVTNGTKGVAWSIQNFQAGFGQGGAIFSSGVALITNSTFSQNIAIGGNGFTNSQIIANAAYGLGGALYVYNGSCSIINCTIVNNLTTNGTLPNPGSIGGIGGGIYNQSGVVSLLNTIVAGNIATINSPDLNGTFVSSGVNLIGNNQGATGLSIYDFQNVPANLGPLQDNGGSSLTCAPLSGSFAVGYGAGAGAPTADQRGVPRPQNGAYDIGAVQTVTNTPCLMNNAFAKGAGFTMDSIFDATNKYRIQASTNLTTWVDLYTNANGGILHFADSTATNLNRRFYRAAKP